MTNFARSAFVAASLSIFAAGSASASTVTADYSLGAGTGVTITSSTSGTTGNVFAGNFVLDPVNGDNFITFCVDLAHTIANGVTYEMKSLADSGFSTTVQTNINRLFSSFYATLNGDNTETAAFQTALWEIVDEAATNPFDISEGSFSVASSTVGTRAQAMLDGLGDATSAWDFTFYDAGENQNQLSATPGGTGGQVPLPAGLPLLLTTLGAFAAIRRGKKQA